MKAPEHGITRRASRVGDIVIVRTVLGVCYGAVHPTVEVSVQELSDFFDVGKLLDIDVGERDTVGARAAGERRRSAGLGTARSRVSARCRTRHWVRAKRTSRPSARDV